MHYPHRELKEPLAPLGPLPNAGEEAKHSLSNLQFEPLVTEQIPWPYSASDRRFSAKLVPILRIEGTTWSALRIPIAIFSVF
jgi:hypothetical protein